MDTSLLLPLLFIVVLALPLILGSRRQKRAMAEAQQLQSSLIEGDRVVTTSGLQATIVSTADETTVDLEIAPGVRTTWLRAAIREKIPQDDDESTLRDDEPAGLDTEPTPPVEGSTRPGKA
ncbi:MAG TPA: preprotein translocase subunit YajC [Pseudonocardiaceae bacterium]